MRLVKWTYSMICRSRVTLIGVALAAVHGGGLATSADAGTDAVLARVGGESITAADLAAFDDQLVEGHKKGKTGVAADSLLLESIIDMRVMTLEAKSRGIDKEPWYEPKVETFHNMRVLKSYVSKNINQQVVMTDDELQEHFLATNRHRALRLAGILVDTEAEAEELLDELDEGGDFAELAREHSLYVATKDQGGDIGIYLPKEATSEALRDKIFHLEVGAVSEPIRYPYEGKWRYTIIKILDEAPVPFWDVEQIVRGEVYERKRAEREAAVTDSLVAVYEPRLHLDFVGRMVRSIRDAQSDTIASGIPTGIDPDAAVCTYKGGVMRLRDLQNLSAKGRRPTDFSDSSAFVDYLQDREVKFRLFLEEARTAGLYEQPKVLKVVEFERQDLLVSTLKERAVDPRTVATDEEARAFYEGHPEAFLTYPTYEVVEILVAFEDLARQVRAEIDQGADAEELAASHSIREGAGHHGGRLSLHLKSPHRDLYKALEGYEEGDIGGPVRLPKGYSVFKVLSSSGREVKPLDAVEMRRARGYVKLNKSKQAYRAYVESLRQKYPIEVFWEELAKLHS